MVVVLPFDYLALTFSKGYAETYRINVGYNANITSLDTSQVIVTGYRRGKRAGGY